MTRERAEALQKVMMADGLVMERVEAVETTLRYRAIWDTGGNSGYLVNVRLLLKDLGSSGYDVYKEDEWTMLRDDIANYQLGRDRGSWEALPGRIFWL